MLEQAENSLEHAEEAVRLAPKGSVGRQGVELVQERLEEEKRRLSSLDGQAGESQD